jgi:putative ABC transport system permease protein
MFRDLRFALRRLTRSFGFSATVVLLLGIALGANGCLFSVIYGLLYKSLPFASAERIVSIDTRLANMGFNVGLSVPYFDEIAAHAKTLDGAAAYHAKDVADGEPDSTSTYKAGIVQPAMFTLLGAQPQIGRLLNDDDAREGAAHSVVISWNFWQERYAGAPDAVGRSLKLGDGDYRIVGVASRFSERHDATLAAARVQAVRTRSGSIRLLRRLAVDRTPAQWCNRRRRQR